LLNEAWVPAIERLLPPPPADVLDIGTGTGFVAFIASSLGHRVTGLDLSAAMLAEARMEAGRRGLDVTFGLVSTARGSFGPSAFAGRQGTKHACRSGNEAC
jgi:protein-L-isoaspartate O-methyltransferase